eukprot:CAMPEP_0176415514 /NCGR_PEP_ID=MMETSP0127-20121128/5848_1 /TAXON_ID=938130 /ORGANISM="Platyophrya macrostoma, Strain WH" /LENGTH=586 /DNA_ID=CAMNT_0017795517 /DNA_START=636 /DNA_END=2396 /DNA_ORIENTATION=-
MQGKMNDLCLGDNIAELMEQVRTNQQELIDEVRQCKEASAFLEARWYQNATGQSNDDDIFSEKSHTGEFDLQLSDSEGLAAPKSRLLRLNNLFYAVIQNYCAMIFDYLSNLDNTYNLVAEYSTRWTVYTYTILQLIQSCQGFTETMNEAYEQLFPGYPSFPKFSIWRLMVKTWFSEVYEKCGISKLLSDSYLKIVSNHRENLLREEINSNFPGISKQLDSTLDLQVPKQLFLNFSTKQDRSMVFDTCGIMKEINNNRHPYFSKDTQAESKLLNDFHQNIIDLSVNEVNMHYIDCTDIESNYPFSELESSILQQSYSYYQDQAKVFEESPSFYCQFLKSDMSFLSDTTTKRTNTKLAKIQIDQCLEFIQKSISNILGKVELDSLDKVEIVPELSTYEPYTQLRDFLIQISSEQNIKFEAQNGRNQEMKLIQKLVAVIEANGHSNFRSDFKFLCDQQALVEQTKAKDYEIKSINMSKNIPYELGDVDALFYDIEKNTDTKLIEKLYQDVQKAMSVDRESFESKSTKASGNLSEDLPEIEGDLEDFELPQLKVKGKNEYREDMPGTEEINFSEFDDFDLPDIDNLILSR